jgi:hypothetical protein
VEVNRAAFTRFKSVADHSFDYGLKVLEEALAIGRQAEPTSLANSPVLRRR